MSTDPSAIVMPDGLTAPVQLFLRTLAGRNLSQHTITAYKTDLRQILVYVADKSVGITRIGQVKQADITEFLAHLASQRRSGVTRARKLAALKELFKFLSLRC